MTEKKEVRKEKPRCCEPVWREPILRSLCKTWNSRNDYCMAMCLCAHVPLGILFDSQGYI